MGVTAAKNQLLTFSDEEEVGGQTFAGWPMTPAEVAARWSDVWFAAVGDLIAPVVVLPPAASKALWEATMAPLVTVPGGGIAALDAAAVAAFPLLAASILPNLILLPPPTPLLPILTAALAPFILGWPEPVAPALAMATALQTWIATAQWTTPGPPVPTPFQMAP